MPIIEPKRMLSEMKVREAMRRITVSIPEDTTIEQTIRCVIKHKINAVLITGGMMCAAIGAVRPLLATIQMRSGGMFSSPVRWR